MERFIRVSAGVVASVRPVCPVYGRTLHRDKTPLRGRPVRLLGSVDNRSHSAWHPAGWLSGGHARKARAAIRSFDRNQRCRYSYAPPQLCRGVAACRLCCWHEIHDDLQTNWCYYCSMLHCQNPVYNDCSRHRTPHYRIENILSIITPHAIVCPVNPYRVCHQTGKFQSA